MNEWMYQNLTIVTSLFSFMHLLSSTDSWKFVSNIPTHSWTLTRKSGNCYRVLISTPRQLLDLYRANLIRVQCLHYCANNEIFCAVCIMINSFRGWAYLWYCKLCYYTWISSDKYCSVSIFIRPTIIQYGMIFVIFKIKGGFTLYGL